MTAPRAMSTDAILVVARAVVEPAMVSGASVVM